MKRPISDKKMPLEVRLWNRVDRRGPDECWPWIGNSSQGRGQFYLHGKTLKAYRVVYAMVHGVGLSAIETLDHLCGNTMCVNPKHLEPCSRGENTRRYQAKGAPGTCPVLDWARVNEPPTDGANPAPTPASVNADAVEVAELRADFEKCFDIVQRLAARCPDTPGAWGGSVSERLERLVFQDGDGWVPCSKEMPPLKAVAQVWVPGATYPVTAQLWEDGHWYHADEDGGRFYYDDGEASLLRFPPSHWRPLSRRPVDSVGSGQAT